MPRVGRSCPTGLPVLLGSLAAGLSPPPRAAAVVTWWPLWLVARYPLQVAAWSQLQVAPARAAGVTWWTLRPPLRAQRARGVSTGGGGDLVATAGGGAVSTAAGSEGDLVATAAGGTVCAAGGGDLVAGTVFAGGSTGC